MDVEVAIVLNPAAVRHLSENQHHLHDIPIVRKEAHEAFRVAGEPGRIKVVENFAKGRLENRRSTPNTISFSKKTSVF